MPDGSQFGREITARREPAYVTKPVEAPEFEQLLARATNVAFWDHWLARDVASDINKFCGRVRFNRPDGPWGAEEVAVQLREAASISYHPEVRLTLFQWAKPIIEHRPALQAQEVPAWRQLVDSPFMATTFKWMEDSIAQQKKAASEVAPSALPSFMRPAMPFNPAVHGMSLR